MRFHLNVIWIIRESNVSIIVVESRHALPLLDNCYLIFVHAKIIVLLEESHSLIIGVSTSHDTKRKLFALCITRLKGEDCFNVELDVGCFGCKLSRKSNLNISIAKTFPQTTSNQNETALSHLLQPALFRAQIRLRPHLERFSIGHTRRPTLQRIFSPSTLLKQSHRVRKVSHQSAVGVRFVHRFQLGHQFLLLVVKFGIIAPIFEQMRLIR
mmetsp:Transcript_41287/g.70672  ORF Transcript_41287/g.70672 Transcript_41287/m.70672 type:complete len:212 (-) Transcript_41287:484-1119(-)